MKIVTPVLVACVTAGVVLALVNYRLAHASSACALKGLADAHAAVSKEVKDISAQLVVQSRGFCATVSTDMAFAMKLIVEKDASAPEVSDIAGRYMKAMNFDFLEITDAEYKILSSGHFPASAGNILTRKSAMPERAATCLYENIRGTETLSLQVKIPFTCEGVKFYCFGGIAVDTAFISRMQPFPGITLFIKQGGEILGMDDIQTMSAIKDNVIVINDKQWFAASHALPWVGEGDAPELILLKKEAGSMNLLDLL